MKKIMLAIAFALVVAPVVSADALLRWQLNDPADNAQGYRIYIDHAQVAQVPANVQTYELAGLIEGETHIYGVTAFNGAGESPPAEIQFTYEPSKTVVYPRRPNVLKIVFKGGE